MVFSPKMDLRSWAFPILSRYFRAAPNLVNALPISRIPWPKVETLPPRLTWVPLPGFAEKSAVNGGLLVPAWTIDQGEGPSWRRTDWYSAAAWYLYGAAERAHEQTHGPIHSYRFRLTGWDDRMWDRAWTNRIGLFLRLWAAQAAGVSEHALGPLPIPSVHLTHDVDYLAKTLAVRIKQGAFECFKALRSAIRQDLNGMCGQWDRACRFLFSRAEYDLCLSVAQQVAARGMRSSFFFYGGRGGPWRRPLLQLLDPSYDVTAPRRATLVRELRRRDFAVGLHQSFDSFGATSRERRHRHNPMLMEKRRVEKALGHSVAACRQHWLRFSWADTWTAQAEAGLRLDTTLGFNDRPGFRNSSALAIHPLDSQTGRELPLTALPMLFMDAHFFDYADLDEAQRRAQLSRWIAEVRDVGGEISVLWHPYVLSRDFGRADLFQHLLDELQGFETRIDLADD